jgi:hypothetical protein
MAVDLKRDEPVHSCGCWNTGCTAMTPIPIAMTIKMINPIFFMLVTGFEERIVYVESR